MKGRNHVWQFIYNNLKLRTETEQGGNNGDW